MRHRALLCTIPVIAIACQGDCVSIARMAFIVTVQDAVTRAPLVAGTSLVVRGPAGADSVTYPLDLPPTVTTLALSEAFLDEGRYTVEVRRAGYQPWRRDDVLLRDGACGHPEAPVQLTALLIAN